MEKSRQVLWRSRCELEKKAMTKMSAVAAVVVATLTTTMTTVKKPQDGGTCSDSGDGGCDGDSGPAAAVELKVIAALLIRSLCSCDGDDADDATVGRPSLKLSPGSVNCEGSIDENTMNYSFNSWNASISYSASRSPSHWLNYVLISINYA